MLSLPKEVFSSMLFDPENGLYVFEVSIGFKANGEKQSSASCLIQADDLEEAEEKVMEYLDNLDLDQRFWIEEISDPYSIEEYQQQLEEDESEPFPLLDEMTEDEFVEFLGF